MVGEGNDLAEAKIVGKRRGEEDSLHGGNKSCCGVKRAKNVELLEGDGLDESANLEKNIDIQNRQGGEKFGGDEDVILPTFGEGSAQGQDEKEEKECGEERMLDSSSTKQQQQLRDDRLLKDGVCGDAQNGRSTGQMLTRLKRPQSAWMMFLADKRPQVNNKQL